MSNCHPLEVVGCGSETQLHVRENLNKITWVAEGYTVIPNAMLDQALLTASI